MIIPRIHFMGDDFAKIMNSVFAENVRDLLDKVDYGTDGYEEGFMHTSTVKHEGTCYYEQVWSRDGGRGIIELARLGFAEEAVKVARYFLRHITFDDHWGRVVTVTRYGRNELDGNSYALLGIYNAYKAAGKNKDIGIEFLTGAEPVITWVERLCEQSPYDGLLPSSSELSGNPTAPYMVYGLFGNYAMAVAVQALSQMADECGNRGASERLRKIYGRIMNAAAARLVSDGRISLAPAGVWFNGIDERDGRAYDYSEWDHTSWPIYYWTRQLPFVMNSDAGSFDRSSFGYEEIHHKSYEYILDRMAKDQLFRKYGFVSNTCWTGMGGRHDDTMCGYGQGFFTQAALMSDDVNTYSKCLEGIARLAYDGNVIKPLTYEMNPWLMHECFNYENYEKGEDHTFGVHSNGRREIYENPGDEGNLVQAAEIIKSFSLVVGVRSEGDRLVIAPRIPWLWEGLEVRDYPVNLPDGGIGRISFTYKNERWLREAYIEVSAPEGFKGVDVRFGPFPYYINGLEDKNLEVVKSKNATWIWERGLPLSCKKRIAFW